MMPPGDVVIRGEYRPCAECHAGSPLGQWPKDWPLTVRRESSGAVLITPHLPDCKESDRK